MANFNILYLPENAMRDLDCRRADPLSTAGFSART